MEKNEIIKSLNFKKNNQKDSIFSKKMNKNIFNNILLPFFSFDQYKELIKVNKYFYNNIILINITWIKYLNEIKNKFNLLIPLNKIDFCKEIALKNKRYYKCNFDKSHYIRFVNTGIEHIGTFDKENWAWKNNKQYWKEKENNNDSLFGEKIISLITVCYVDTNLTLTKIPYGKYKLYIRHNVYNNDDGDLILTIKLNDIEIYKKNYPENYMLEDCKNDINNNEKNNLEKKENKTECDADFNIPEIKGKIANSFLIDVIIDDNQKDDNTIFIKFNHIIGHWKRNWDLDAIILTPVN
jgi:hypothetical protein